MKNYNIFILFGYVIVLIMCFSIAYLLYDTGGLIALLIVLILSIGWIIQPLKKWEG